MSDAEPPWAPQQGSSRDAAELRARLNAWFEKRLGPREIGAEWPRQADEVIHHRDVLQQMIEGVFRGEIGRRDALGANE